MKSLQEPVMQVYDGVVNRRKKQGRELAGEES